MQLPRCANHGTDTGSLGPNIIASYGPPREQGGAHGLAVATVRTVATSPRVEPEVVERRTPVLLVRGRRAPASEGGRRRWIHPGRRACRGTRLRTRSRCGVVGGS